MSMYQPRQTWPIARLLFATHIPALLVLWAIFAVVVVAIMVGLAIFTNATGSIWVGAVQFVRWFSFGYGIYLIRQQLPAFVAHGQTRRDFMIQASVFTLAATVVLCVLMMLGFVLEMVVYRIMDRQQALAAVQLVVASEQLTTTFFTYLAMYLVWIVCGAMLGAAFYRNDGWFLLALPLALILVSLAGASANFSGLPFVTRMVAGMRISSGIVVPLSVVLFLLGLAMTWAMIRDIAVQTRTG